MLASKIENSSIFIPAGLHSYQNLKSRGNKKKY